MKISWSALTRWIGEVFKKKEDISFPERVSFEHEDPETFFDKFKTVFDQVPKDGKEVIFNLGSSEFIYPSSLIFLIAVVESCSDKKINFSSEIKVDGKVHEYLDFAEFGKIVAIPKFPDAKKTLHSKVIPLHATTKLGDSYNIATKLTDILKEHQPMSITVEANVLDSLDEIFRNIRQHSAYTKAYYIAQSFPESKRLRFTIYDNGIGIKSHLTRLNYDETHPQFKELITREDYEKMKSSPANEAISKAAIKMVSGTNYKTNSGAGLNFLIQELAVPTEGQVYVISEDGFVRWNKGVIDKSFALPFKLKGTIVSATINVSGDSYLKYNNE